MFFSLFLFKYTGYKSKNRMECMTSFLNKKIVFLFYIFFICLQINAADATTDDVDYSWIYSFINVDPSDDAFNYFKPKYYKVNKEYIKNLKYNQNMYFFIDELDQYNIKKNINSLPKFPLIFMAYGGYTYTRGFDLGFLFRADDIKGFAYTSAISYGMNGHFWLHNGLEYNRFLDGRLKVLGNFSFFTSAMQYSANLMRYSAVSNYDAPSTGEQLGLFITSFLNKVFNKLDVQFYKQSETGFYFTGGVDYRIPIFELNLIPTLQFIYKYIDKKDITYTGRYSTYSYPYSPNEKKIDENNFGVNIGLDLVWDHMKQTKTIPEGFSISAKTKFYLPTTLGDQNDEFRFTSKFEGKLTKKVIREFSFRGRLLLALNYNISEDFSGDPYVRGLATQEMTGWFALLANVEAFIPIVDIDMFTAGDVKLSSVAKFVIYFVLFGDFGFSIENYNYFLKDSYQRADRFQIRNSLERGNIKGQYYIGKDNYLLPAATFGTGIHVHSFFLHFSLRFDVAFNIIKIAVYANNVDQNYGNQRKLTGAEFVDFTFSFSEMF